MAGRTSDKELTNQQIRFCEEYVANKGNGKQAAILAGYSYKGAEVTASQLLTIPKVKEKVERLRAETSKRVGLKAEHVIEELKSLGFSNLSDYLKDDMTLEDFKKLPRSVSAAIASIEIQKVSIPGTEGTRETVKFKLHDKHKALDSLGKNFGIYDEHNKQKTGAMDLTALTDEELHQLIKLQEKAKKVDD